MMAASQTVILVSQNLFFLPRIQNAASAQGFEARMAGTVSEFWNACEQANPDLVLLDMEGDADVWSEVLEGIRGRDEAVRLVAFGPHSDAAGMKRAKELGCDSVLSKGEFTRDLAKVIASAKE